MANRKKTSKITEIDQKMSLFKETRQKKEVFFHIRN